MATDAKEINEDGTCADCLTDLDAHCAACGECECTCGVEKCEECDGTGLYGGCDECEECGGTGKI